MMIEEKDCGHALILIIDDDAAHRTIARKALEQAGFAVEEAESGEEGLCVVERARPDLILLDIMMPKLSGYDVCTELRRNPQFVNLPVLMVTALDDVESVNLAFEAGATNFIIKPINWTLLAYHVKYALRASQTEDELRKTKKLLESVRASA
jgi:DNA-binding response OmpR family regulator